MRGKPEGDPESWGAAAAKALLVLGAAYLGFAFVADRLTTFLATRVSPDVRDVLVAGWVAGWLVVLSLGFVALQRRSRG